ncbi:MAG: hypothetical protein A2X94_14125 [Bdellovibrionales bacterium GWB1_55_8]|nr:MAG: hypothetical protein A2X94_14125 [Bdellovibrionales bacterium GWB1_55_8]
MRETLLNELLSQPTAPYRERLVVHRILAALKEGGVPHFSDPVGNIIVGAASKAEYRKLVSKKADEPLRIFMAHMDHPGFHGVRWNSPADLEVKWHGGAPTHFLENCRVWLTNGKEWKGQGRISKFTLNAAGTSIDTAQIRLNEDKEIENRRERIEAGDLYGAFDFRAPVWREGELIYTRAADDIVGCFAIVSVALDLWSEKKKRGKFPFLGLLTRAEEVGFIGAIGHLELGWLKKARRSLVFVSLETSRTLPGAEIGKGPVVRLGDRFTVFDATSLRVFADVAEKVLPGSHQKRVMDGGTCEASAATVFGHRAMGISIPLGNYHNQGFQGGPDASSPAGDMAGPAPEFVHLQDVSGMITLCHGLLQPKLSWADPWKTKKQAFRKNLRAARPLLRSGP